MILSRNGTSASTNLRRNNLPPEIDIVESDLETIEDFYLDTIIHFSKLDESVYYVNATSIIDNMLDSEKTISADVMVYLMQNMSLIITLLVIDYKDFRNIFATLLEDEIRFEDMTEQERIVERRKVEPIGLPKSKIMTIDKDCFNGKELSALLYLAMKSFTKIENSAFADFVNEYEETQYTDDDRAIVGTLLSDFMHIIRGCNHNRKFIPTMHMVLEDAKKTFRLTETL